MSNIHNERLMEDLYYKHLEVQEKIFGEGDSNVLKVYVAFYINKQPNILESLEVSITGD